MSKNVEESKKEDPKQEPDLVKEEPQNSVSADLFPNEPTGISPEEKLLLLQELQTLGTLMNATWNKPIYVGKETKNPELQRSIPVNIFSDGHLLIMKKRTDEVLKKLQWIK